MNNTANPALMTDPDHPPSQGAFPVWSKVFTKPSVQTFVEITSHPEARARTAYIWVFLVGTLAGLINSLARIIIMLVGLREFLPDLGKLPGGPAVLGFGGLLTAICSAPLTGLCSVISFMIGVAIIQATARFFGGQGSFEKLAYAFGAIAVPISLISALMVPLNAVPFAAFCSVPVLLALGLYTIFLELSAIRAVHQCGWGGAAAAFFLPVVLISMVCGIVFLGLIQLAGPSINDIFQQLQSLQ